VADSTRRSQSPHTGAFGLKREPIEISDEPRGSRPGSTRGRWCNSTGRLTRLRAARCQRSYFVVLRTLIDGTVPSLMAVNWNR
jgi:hypothetical protein